MKPNTIPTPAQNGNSWGALIGTVVIIIVLVIGGLYFWGSQLSERNAVSPPEQTSQ